MIGQKANDFTLQGITPEGEKKEFSLKELLNEGKNIVIYFYPKDNTPGCTQEACDFRDNLARLTSKALVFGVSPDSVESHIKFAQKQELNFPLLSDPEHKMLEEYQAWGEKKMYGKTYMGVIRSTVLIDKQGVVRNHWPKVKVKGHVDEVMAALEQL